MSLIFLIKCHHHIMIGVQLTGSINTGNELQQTIIVLPLAKRLSLLYIDLVRQTPAASCTSQFCLSNTPAGETSAITFNVEMYTLGHQAFRVEEKTATGPMTHRTIAVIGNVKLFNSPSPEMVVNLNEGFCDSGELTLRWILRVFTDDQSTLVWVMVHTFQ